jgi:hypothetical protein
MFTSSADHPNSFLLRALYIFFTLTCTSPAGRNAR